MLVQLHIMCGWFCVTVAELSSCVRDCVLQSQRYSLSGLYRKGLLTLVVEDEIRNKNLDVYFAKKYGCLYQYKRKGGNNNGWRNWKLEAVKKEGDEKHVWEHPFLCEVKSLCYLLNEMRLATSALWEEGRLWNNAYLCIIKKRNSTTEGNSQKITF